MDIRISVDSNSKYIQESQNIRRKVFVEEQDIPAELDLDGLDGNSYHALAELDNNVVGTARLFIRGNKGILARVAVLKEYRGLGIAGKLIRSMLSFSQNLQVGYIEIHAHKHLKSYYESFGFSYVRDVEVIGQHQLIEMSAQVSVT